jgi:homoaconitase/3-isopropylmalate dehydratase large subunit
LHSDPDAEYAAVIELDAAEITPMVATPGDPGNGKYIRELGARVPIEIAYGGTCTAGKNEDMDMYAAVLADALKHGRRVARECGVLDSVRLAGDARVLEAAWLHGNFRASGREA